MSSSRIKTFVDRLAQRHGWHGDDLIPNVASRDYDTAIGPRPASVWFTVCKETGAVYAWPEYQSEGRNALACCGTSWPMSLGEADALDRLDRFAASLDTAVAQTYAARLLRDSRCQPASPSSAPCPL